MQDDRVSTFGFRLEHLETSENYQLSGTERNVAHHRLIDQAINLANYDAWVQLGELLIRAAAKNDLSYGVSDRFVDNCPDDAFSKIVRLGDVPLAGWRRRANSLR